MTGAVGDAGLDGGVGSSVPGDVGGDVVGSPGRSDDVMTGGDVMMGDDAGDDAAEELGEAVSGEAGGEEGVGERVLRDVDVDVDVDVDTDLADADAELERRELGGDVDSCSWTNIMWSPRRMASVSGLLPDRKSFTCRTQTDNNIVRNEIHV